MKRIIKILLYILIINPLLLTSCWNYREADNLTLVRGLAIDKAEDNNYLVSAETADMHEEGMEGKAKSVIIESKGETIFDAVRNAILVNVPRLYWGHTTVVVISQKLAQEGVTPVMDFLTRDHETRLEMHPVIYQGNEAKEIFKAKPFTAEIISEEIRDMLYEQKRISKAVQVQIYEFMECLASEGVSGIMPVVRLEEIAGEKVIRLCGTAVFKKDKLIGYLDEDETKYLCFVLDEVEGGVLTVNVGSKEDNGKITLEILKSKTKVKPSYKEDKITIEIKIRIRAVLDEVRTRIKFNDQKDLDELAKIAGEQLKGHIENVIKKAQNSNSDIFGFGLQVKRSLPKVWKEKGKDWDKLFRELEVNIIPDIEIVHTGLLIKSVEVGE